MLIVSTACIIPAVIAPKEIPLIVAFLSPCSQSAESRVRGRVAFVT